MRHPRALTLHQAVFAVAPTRVLVAVADPALRRFLCVTLERDGYEVAPAPDDSGRCEELRSLPVGAAAPDVVIVEARLPELEGLELLAHARRMGSTTRVVLILDGPGELRAAARPLGAAAVLERPLDPERLRAVILSVSRSSRGGVRSS